MSERGLWEDMFKYFKMPQLRAIAFQMIGFYDELGDTRRRFNLFSNAYL